MRKFLGLIVIGFCGAAVCTTTLAGTTEVRFIEPARFTDTHLNGEPVGDVLIELERLMVGLGQQCLPPGQTLVIDILDVDLAGTGRYVPARQGEVRLITSGVDAPRITLRYTLAENGRNIAGKEETLRDLGFLEHRRLRTTNESYPYEKRLLRDWFKERFGAACEVKISGLSPTVNLSSVRP